MRNASSRGSGGFTLVEILAVIAVLALLVILLTPTVQKGIESANAAKCVNNMRQLGVGLLTYAGEHNGKFPPLPTADDTAAKDISKGWQGRIADYVGYNPTKEQGPPIFACPSGIRNPKSIPLYQWRGYAMNEFVQDVTYQNNAVFENIRQALLVEFWVENTHTMAGVLMLAGSSQVNFGQKSRLAWRHNRAMNLLLKDGSVTQSLPGQSEQGADINWLYRDGQVWRDGQYRDQ